EYINIDCTHIPAENVFIIDIYTWNNLIQILKNKKELTILDILKKAKDNNMNSVTSKLLFSMHLNEYFENDNNNLSLQFLNNETNLLKIKPYYN
ncbi:hypothetical protein, partial [Chryseobacterium sp. 8AT]